MLILVTGATGYIASRLIPQLLDRGHTVRALARRPHQIGPRNWSSQISIFPGDVMNPASLAPALKDVHTAYYLIHNMSSTYYTNWKSAAHNFAVAAEEAVYNTSFILRPRRPRRAHRATPALTY
jgi:uncharacterized protein YbjT (DUF2867 family)